MAPEDVLRVLRKSSAPDRKLDKRIAPFAGYRRHTGNDEVGEDVVVFLNSKGESVKVPAFTRDLDDAQALVTFMFPERAVAVSWEPGEKYKAQVEGAPAEEADNPALAICIAAFAAYVNVAGSSRQ